jgi:hypothetical protein
MSPRDLVYVVKNNLEALRTSAMKITYDSHSDILTLTQDHNVSTEHGFESPAPGI